MTNRRTIATLMLGAAIALGACSKKDAGVADTGIGIGSGTGAAGGMMDTGMAVIPTALTDANIVYILDAANRVDSAAG